MHHAVVAVRLDRLVADVSDPKFPEKADTMIVPGDVVTLRGHAISLAKKLAFDDDAGKLIVEWSTTIEASDCPCMIISIDPDAYRLMDDRRVTFVLLLTRTGTIGWASTFEINDFLRRL